MEVKRPAGPSPGSHGRLSSVAKTSTIVRLLNDSLLEKGKEPGILQSCLLCRLMEIVESQGALVQERHSLVLLDFNENKTCRLGRHSVLSEIHITVNETLGEPCHLCSIHLPLSINCIFIFTF